MKTKTILEEYIDRLTEFIAAKRGLCPIHHVPLEDTWWDSIICPLCDEEEFEAGQCV